MRKLNADISNKHLAKNGFDERVDHRTLEAQGIDRLPQIHLSRAEMELEKRGKKTKKGDYNRLIAEQNAIRKELQEVEKQLSLSQHTTKKRKSLLKQWHNNNFSHEPPLCQTLTDSVKY